MTVDTVSQLCLIAIFLEMCKQASINDTLMTRKESVKEYRKIRKSPKSERSEADSSSDGESEWDEAQINYARCQLSMNLVPQGGTMSQPRSHRSLCQSQTTNDFESVQFNDSMVE